MLYLKLQQGSFKKKKVNLYRSFYKANQFSWFILETEKIVHVMQYIKMIFYFYH